MSVPGFSGGGRAAAGRRRAGGGGAAAAGPGGALPPRGGGRAAKHRMAEYEFQGPNTNFKGGARVSKVEKECQRWNYTCISILKVGEKLKFPEKIEKYS